MQLIILFDSGESHEKLIHSLQLLEWYQENYFKANEDKCHVFLSPFCNKEKVALFHDTRLND